jgi:ABC-2 type transport system ATP-binding protein
MGEPPVDREGNSGRAPGEFAGQASPGETLPVIRCEAVSRRFGDRTAVDRLSFDVLRGELFGIVGPDGAGKTTTLRVLAGVLPPTTGDALVLGVSVARDPERIKPHIAYMAQRFGLYEDLTVRENIEFYADLYGVPARERGARLERLYAFSGLHPFERRLAGALSGGMKQKLSLSCALIHQPKVLLLDEPTFGVDPISRRELWLILHEMIEGGVTIVVSTSYLDEAERCDRVVLLDGGRALAVDSPESLQRYLAGPLYELRVANPRRARAVLLAGTDVHSAVLFGDRLHVQPHPGVSADKLLDAVRAAGESSPEIRPIRPSLEDAFIERVQGGSRGAGVA